MTVIELAAEQIGRNLEMLKMHLADFSDADMLVRPVPGANHMAWQLGHVIASENGMLSTVKPGAAVELPEGFREQFGKGTTTSDDPKAFPSKAELLDAFTKTRAATVAWVKTLTEADLGVPSPERMRPFASTIGALLFLIPVHTTMHIGQLQVIRRKLGKPILF